MKKIISLIMVISMMLSAISFLSINSMAEYLEGELGIDYVEAPYFTSAPTIDGYVSEAEWGERLFYANSDDAANLFFNSPYYNTFVSYFWEDKYIAEVCKHEFDGWLGWDENNFYVAVKVRDYDGHSLRFGSHETWNGDSIEFILDPQGPNSSMGGDPYDPAMESPWEDVTILPDIMAGYVQVAGGFVECFDKQAQIGLTDYSRPVFGAVDVAVAPSDEGAENPINYSEDTQMGYTTYELAVPWKYIFERDLLNVPASQLTPEELAPYTLDYSDYHFRNNPKGGIGYEFGMSMTLHNSPRGESKVKTFMNWGCGIARQELWQPQTGAGSNSVVLSGTKFTPAEGYKTYDPSVLEKVSFNTSNYDNVFYDYLGGDIYRETPVKYEDLKTLTYDDPNDMDFWGCADRFQGSLLDVGGDHGMVLNYDKMLETKTDDSGNTRFEGVDAIDQFYIDTTISDDVDFRYPISYTMEFDIMFTGNEIVQEGRDSLLMNWFGGARGYSYQCGYSFNDRKFVINENNDKMLDSTFASKDYEFLKDTWYNWKFQYDNESCTVRLLINDEVIFNVYNRYFYYSDEQWQKDGALMIFWMINTQCKYDNVKIYNFYDYLHEDAGATITPGGNITGPSTSTESGGTDIDVNVVEKEDGTFSIPVLAKPEYKTVTTISYNFSFDTEKYEFVGVEGLDASDYTAEQKADGSYLVTIKNIAKIKAAATGDKLFELVFKAKAEGAKADGLTLKLSDTYKYTVVTSDNMLLVALIATVAMAAVTTVGVYKKRRTY